MSLRGSIAAALVTVLTIGSLGLVAAPVSAASIAGTIRPDLVTNGTSFGPVFTDDESASDIAGITYEMFFSDDGTTPTNDVYGYQNTGTLTQTVLAQPDPIAAFTIRSATSVPFSLASFAIQDAQYLDAEYTVTAYNDGVALGTQSFLMPPAGALQTVSLGSSFRFVDQVRVTSDGGVGVSNKLWQEGFTDLVVADPVYPATTSTLAGLSLSNAALNPAFTAAGQTYSSSVSNATMSTTVTPTTTDPLSSVTVNGVNVASGTASGAIALNVGSNTITTIVRAADGSTTRTYTTTVSRAAPPSSNNSLSALSLSSGALTPVFASATTAYTVSVSNATTSLTVAPTAADATASVTVNGVAVNSGNASGAIALSVGVNTLTTTVTAQDGTPKSYTVTVTRAGSSNADLAALSLSSGTLAPAFASGTTSYTASVSNATTSLTVTPTLAAATASLTVNGVAVTSGNASGAIALSVGSNTVTTVVTAQNGTPKTYTVTVTRAASGNNDLSALSISAGTLSPVFAPSATSYTASVGFGVASVSVTPTTAVGSAGVAVNGVFVSSGSASGSIALNPGSNTVTVEVTAQNSATKTYTLTISRALPSADANLAALFLSTGTLTPTFASGTTSYTAAVGNATTSLTLTPTVANATASVTVNGVATTSGNASGAIALAVGANTITTTVTAQDGTTSKTYTVTVTRAGSSNANLSGLALAGGSLSPAFDPATAAYSLSIPATTAAVTVTATVAEPNASVEVNGVAVASGAQSGPIAMNSGTNTVTITVTAQNQSTKVYTVTVTKAFPSAVADLGGLALTGIALNPAFAAGTTSYTASVGNATGSVTVTPTVADSTATVTVDGVATTSGASSDPISLAVGNTVIAVAVTAQDGTTVKSYTVTVTRAPSADSSLSALAVSDASLAPAFRSSTTGYAASVANSVSSVTVSATAASTSTVTVNGATASNVPLAVGSNTITVRVTAQDGTTTTDYVITVTRAFVAPGFTDATLGAMQVGVAFADSVAAAGTPVITYAVAGGALPAGLELDPATGSVSGTPTTAGDYDVVISATSPYASVTARIAGTVVAAVLVPAPVIELVPGFTAGTPLTQATLSVSGSNLVPGSAYTIVLFSDPVLLASGTIDATGTLNFSTKVPVGVEAGAHRVVLTVVAPDGSALTDTVWFTVLPGGTIGAVSLVGAVPYTTPAAATAAPMLAATGIDQGFARITILLSALLVLAGIALMVVQFRRSREIC